MFWRRWLRPENGGRDKRMTEKVRLSDRLLSLSNCSVAYLKSINQFDHWFEIEGQPDKSYTTAVNPLINFWCSIITQQTYDESEDIFKDYLVPERWILIMVRIKSDHSAAAYGFLGDYDTADEAMLYGQQFADKLRTILNSDYSLEVKNDLAEQLENEYKPEYITAFY